MTRRDRVANTIISHSLHLRLAYYHDESCRLEQFVEKWNLHFRQKVFRSSILSYHITQIYVDNFKHRRKAYRFVSQCKSIRL